METARPYLQRVALATGWSLANMTLLTFLAFTLADSHEGANSATPVADGAILTLRVVGVLAAANGALLLLSPRSQSIGVGVLLGVLLSVPVGFLILLSFLAQDFA